MQSERSDADAGRERSGGFRVLRFLYLGSRAYGAGPAAARQGSFSRFGPRGRRCPSCYVFGAPGPCLASATLPELRTRAGPLQRRMSRAREYRRLRGAFSRAAGRGLRQPLRGCIGEPTLGEQHRVVELAAKVAGPRRLAVPVGRVLRAATAPPALFIQRATMFIARPCPWAAACRNQRSACGRSGATPRPSNSRLPRLYCPQS